MTGYDKRIGAFQEAVFAGQWGTFVIKELGDLFQAQSLV